MAKKRQQSPVAPRLLIRCGRVSYEADPDDGEVTIGRDDQAGVRIDHPMVSRVHAKVAVSTDEEWFITDVGSRNGLYVHGRRVEYAMIGDGTVVTLGDAAGVEVRFELVDPDEEITRRVAPKGADEDDDDPFDDADPGIMAAGAAVRERRGELNISQRSLAADGIMNAGALIAFEKGRSWPRPGTQRKLEKALQWEPGVISAIRNSYWGNADPDGVTTAVKNFTGESPLVQAIATGVDTVETAVAALPSPTDPRFHERVEAILGNLRQLETVAGSAASDGSPTPMLAVTLGKIRRLRSQLTIMAAQSPNATLGQRLYAARRRLELTEAEAAAAAQLPTETIVSIEAGNAVPAQTAAKVMQLIALLAQT